MNYTLFPVHGLRGTISISGDKSISHRALLLGAIANGVTTTTNLSDCADVQSTAACLRQLGICIETKAEKTYVHGVGLTGFQKSTYALDAGNSGTTMRLLCGLLAGQKFDSIITGDNSLLKRPMNRIIVPLQQMKAKINGTEDGRGPLIIHSSKLSPISYKIPVASAQVKSCILLAGLYANGITSVTEPYQSRDHTERLLSDFGIQIHRDELTVSISGGSQPIAAEIKVPGDISSAAFFLVAAAIIPDSNLKIMNVGLNPNRTGIIDILKEMGANVSINYVDATQNEPIGDISITTSTLSGVTIAADRIPRLIDEIPIIAIAAVKARGRTTISGAKELRVKESDRLHAIVLNLRSMGIEIQDKEDGFIIEGPQEFCGATIESFGDHRIAMAFSIAALIADGPTIIKNAEYVSVSMPNFFKLLKKYTKPF